MFKKKLIQLGNLRVGKKYRANFEYDGVMPKIKKIESPCDCSVPYWDQDRNTVFVDYTPKDQPHLRDQGIYKYHASKNITITFEDETTVTLDFAGTVDMLQQ